MLDGFSWSTSLSALLTQLGNVLVKTVLFLVIFVIGWFIAKLIRRGVAALLAKVGTDRLVERAGLTKALSTKTERPSGLIATILYFGLMLMVLTAAFSVFGPNNPISQLLRDVVAYLPNVFIAIAIVIIAGLLARKVVELLHGVLEGKVSHASLLARAAGIAIMVIGGFAALNQLHIAPAIINGLFFAILAIIVGSSVIAIGGGGIGPMRYQWDKAIAKLESDPGMSSMTSGSRESLEQGYPRHQEH